MFKSRSRYRSRARYGGPFVADGQELVIIGGAMGSVSSGTDGRARGEEHNLPVPLTSLVGRVRELDGIGEMLRRTRLVTITGPGGAGKTRLALELARRQIARRRHGVWLVDLATGSDVPDVAAEVARTLGVGASSETTATDALRRYLANREMLLVFDNCEHVVEACAELAVAVLTACPDVSPCASCHAPTSPGASWPSPRTTAAR